MVFFSQISIICRLAPNNEREKIICFCLVLDEVKKVLRKELKHFLLLK